MYNMQKKVNQGTVRKVFQGALISPGSELSRKSGVLIGPKTVARLVKRQEPATEEEKEKEASLQIQPEASLKAPEPKISENIFDLSQEHLQDVMVWSEILAKPVCKRRKRRQYGD